LAKESPFVISRPVTQYTLHCGCIVAKELNYCLITSEPRLHVSVCLSSSYHTIKMKNKQTPCLSIRKQTILFPTNKAEVLGLIPGARRFFWELLGLELGPLSLVRTNEVLLEREKSDSGLENQDQQTWETSALTTPHPSIRKRWH
jgi:hypothetical protein